jgi:ABC-type multidrug transport system permease subunit
MFKIYCKDKKIYFCEAYHEDAQGNVFFDQTVISKQNILKIENVEMRIYEFFAACFLGVLASILFYYCLVVINIYFGVQK